MSDLTNPTFLSNKFTPARLPEVCAPRKHLMSNFDEAAEDGFVFVFAQGGSGKTITTLLWLEKSECTPVWIGLDSYDNSLSVFYKQLATGIYSLQSGNENMLRILTDTSFSATPVEHTVELLSEMQPDSKQYTIVLDDFHVITNGEILKSLPLVLRRLPYNFTVFILSRGEMMKELFALVRDEKKDIISRERLRFTESEIKQYFKALGRALTSDEAKLAYMATDGWAIGVNAVAKSGKVLQGGKYEFALFFEELAWNSWDSDLRKFCMCTSIADEFDIKLAEELSGRGDAGAVMEYLSKSNSFLSRIYGDTYRYHHLFQEFLQKQIAEIGLNMSELYKTAALYYKERGDYSRALRYWLKSEDYKEIDNFLFLFLFGGNKNGVADYADFLHSFFSKKLPDRAAREAPVLHVLYAWYYYLTSHADDFSRHLDAIIFNLPRIAKAGNEFIEFAMLAFHVDHRKSIQSQVRMYSIFGRLLKHFTHAGLATRIPSFTHNMPYMHRSNRDYSEFALNPEILDKIDVTFAPLLGSEWDYIRSGILVPFEYERNNLESALAQNTAVLSLVSDENKPDGRICVLILQHSILWQLGQESGARYVMDSLLKLVNTSAQHFVTNLIAYRVKLKLFDGDTAAAHEWLDYHHVTYTEHIEFFRSFQHFTTARAYIASGESTRAIHYLHMLKVFGIKQNRPLDRCEAGVVLSALYWVLGRKKDADAELEETLEILQPYGFIRVVADEGAAVVPMLKRLLLKITKKDYTGILDRTYINEVMLAAHSFARHHKGYMSKLEEGRKSANLSKQQKNMLIFLSQGYKNAEISEISGLSIPTIKTHLSLAYKKLNVSRAADAVLKARELGLLE